MGKAAVEINKSIIYIAGLPRSGSTLLCQLLGLHSSVDSSGHSSPLQGVLHALRHQLSDNEFLLSQLDVDFERGYQRLLNINRSVINGWFAETEKDWVVDKNRGWLSQIDLLSQLDPDFKMVVCVREPAQIYGSIEAQHQKTILLDFPDHSAALSRHARADKLFGPEGVIGGPLKAIEALQDIPDALQQRLFYVVFEHLVSEPQAVLSDLYQWLGLPASDFNPAALTVKPHESDSYYRFKYSHQTQTRITPPSRHVIPARIQADIQQQFSDLYQLFYPGLLETHS